MLQEENGLSGRPVIYNSVLLNEVSDRGRGRQQGTLTQFDLDVLHTLALPVIFKTRLLRTTGHRPLFLFYFLLSC